jgi:PAS domain S-box-containing protein
MPVAMDGSTDVAWALTAWPTPTCAPALAPPSACAAFAGWVAVAAASVTSAAGAAGAVSAASEAEAAIAVPLVSSQAQVLGLILLAYNGPLRDASMARTLLETFSARASAELERKLNEETLQKSEQRYRAFIAQGLNGMWRFEFKPPIPTDLPVDEQIDRMYQSGYLAELNETMAHLLGHDSAEELIGATLQTVLPRSDAHGVQELRTGIQAGYKATGVEVQRGRRYRLRSYQGVVVNHTLERIWGTTCDFTDLREARLALEASEKRFRSLLESVTLLAVMLDKEGKIIFSNDETCRATGWSVDELAGKDWFDVLVPAEEREESRAAFLTALSGSAILHRQEASILTRAGAHRLIAWDNTVLRDVEGNVAGAAKLGRDITDQRALELRYQDMQRLESIGRLAGGIAHDFNNILTIIMGRTEILLQSMKKGSSVHAALTDILNAADRAATLTRNLLAFSRRQVLMPTALSFNKMVTENESILRRLLDPGVDLKTELDSQLMPVRADAGQIYQVVMNLVVNARDAMPEGGSLKISTKNIEIPAEASEEFEGIPPGRYAALRVTDTGTGMSTEIQKHLFEPFFTTKEQGHGTGLGLATAHGIIRQSGGYISVQTAPGKGTAFTVLLPAQ